MEPDGTPTTRTAVPGWLAAEMATVPAQDRYPSVDEMIAQEERIAAEHPDVVRRHRVGTSAHGEPITCLTIGDTRRHAVVIGLPHPNEPIGGSTTLHLARRLAADPELLERLGLTWHLVPCIDPDGLRLNEGWLSGPFTREHYARHFYRQAGPEQIEWTFPVDHKDMYFDAVLPETLALMRLIDTYRPELLASLHNAETGGAYYYLSRAEAELHPVLQEVPERVGVPLHRGEPEAPWIPELATGIYRSIDIRDAYDHLETVGEEQSVVGAGNSTGGHAAPHDTLTLVVELPCWRDPRAADTGPAGSGRPAALAERAAGMTELAEVLTGALDDIAGRTWVESPFLRASRFYARLAADTAEADRRRAEAGVADPGGAPATVAEIASIEETLHMFRLRYGNLLLRALEAEIGIGNTTAAVRAARDRVARHVDAWSADAAARAATEPLPIGDLVTVQYTAVVAAAAHLSGTLDGAGGRG
ncbi:M14 family zinc carboxypeptidase [Pseudonocardia sp. HH130630-07]|uniref:M14 family zinc carboxypeptidase n=1 Tax=Pseudonocardia sp. HH130630-07 TaxID=1690815 RepID=UPI000814EF40|nr:M14 family zinc carboxypeptidase [Pseudonocardia sp. HH130630-07]ANY07186.1 hypothetical protein AFB00_13845 [Pseudonocardia sp. HH130630-07]